MSVPLENYLVVGAILFVLGAIGFLTRRNIITMFLSAELLLQGVALNLIAFSKHQANLRGQVFVLFIVAVAACEAGIALALVLVLYRSRKSLDISIWQDLRDPDLDPITDTTPLPAPTAEEPLPRLPEAGRIPNVSRGVAFDA